MKKSPSKDGSRSPATGWFGVKTLFLTKVVGRPKNLDSLYVSQTALLEERVVIFKAISAPEAIRRAEQEAREYAQDVAINPYGQTVKIDFLECCDAFEIDEKPTDRQEVYSSMEIVSSRRSVDSIIDAKFGREEKKGERKKFMDRDL